MRDLRRDGNPIIFWLGETPHRGQFPPNLISLLEAVSVSEKGFALDRKPLEHLFEKRLIPAAHGDIALDKNIALRKHGKKYCLLFEQEKKGGFRYEASIPPLSNRIIRHLYQIRRYKERAESLAEMRDRGFSEYRPSISRSISTINALCEKHGVTPIFHKFPADKWGLNPSLDCCNER